MSARSFAVESHTSHPSSIPPTSHTSLNRYPPSHQKNAEAYTAFTIPFAILTHREDPHQFSSHWWIIERHIADMTNSHRCFFTRAMMNVSCMWLFWWNIMFLAISIENDEADESDSETIDRSSPCEEIHELFWEHVVRPIESKLETILEIMFFGEEADIIEELFWFLLVISWHELDRFEEESFYILPLSTDSVDEFRFEESWSLVIRDVVLEEFFDCAH